MKIRGQSLQVAPLAQSSSVGGWRKPKRHPISPARGEIGSFADCASIGNWSEAMPSTRVAVDIPHLPGSFQEAGGNSTREKFSLCHKTTHADDQNNGLRKIV
ncbi:MAG: hypothetical protein E5W87_06055 [Mesorhizobium sp.]|nr:MAG: hypothetical protein E5W87_06055 [Mesorhizobium sp.]